MPNFICNNCPTGSTTYPTMYSLQQHIREEHLPQRRSDYKIPPTVVEKAQQVKVPIPPPASLVSVEPSKPKRKPVLLKYQYQGECETCGVPVETHEIKVETGLYMIAWCPNCRKQLKDLKVIPIDQFQKIKEEEEELEIDEATSFPINKFKKK